jgi:putative FmdB family regulatory protein
MPTYGYKCEKCGLEFEARQSISAKPLAVCPRETCARKPWGKGRVKRQIVAGGGLIFKGSGFYATDYRSDSYKQSAKNDSAPAKSPPAAAPASDAKVPAAAVKVPAAESKSAPKVDPK